MRDPSTREIPIREGYYTVSTLKDGSRTITGPCWGGKSHKVVRIELVQGDIFDVTHQYNGKTETMRCHMANMGEVKLNFKVKQITTKDEVIMLGNQTVEGGPIPKGSILRDVKVDDEKHSVQITYVAPENDVPVTMEITEYICLDYAL